MKYTFKNTTSAEIVLVVEPWAEEFFVPSGSVLELEIGASSIEAGPLETVMSDKYFAVWLWGGCRATVSLESPIGDQETPRL